MQTLKDEKGAALVATLLLMVVGVILVTGMMAMSLSENKQSIYQTKNMKAYYIARAGADAMVHRLLTIDKQYWDDFTTQHKTNPADFSDGSVDVTVLRSDDNFQVVSTGTYQDAEKEVKAVLKYNPNTKMEYVIFSKDPMVDLQLGDLNDDIGSGGSIGWKTPSYGRDFGEYANENVTFNPEINMVNFSGVESSLIEGDPASLLTEVSSVFSTPFDLSHTTWTIDTDGTDGTGGADFNKQEDTVTHVISMEAGDQWMIIWLKEPSVIDNLNITGNKNLMIVVEDKLEIKGTVNLSGSGSVEFHVIDGSDAEDDLILSSPHMTMGGMSHPEKCIIYLCDGSQMKMDVNGEFYGYIIGPEAFVSMKNPHTTLYGGLYCKAVDIDANVEVYSATPGDANPIRLESIQFRYWE